MKKIIPLSILFVGLGVLSGCANNQEMTQSGNQMQKGEDQNMEGSMGSAINNIKDAIGSGQKMKCTYTIRQNAQEYKSEAFIDGKKYKSVSTVDGHTSNAIFDGKETYAWTDDAAKGMKINEECAQQNQIENQEQNEMAQGDVQTNGDPFDGAVDVKCEKVDSIDFSVPSDVEFTDQCEMLKLQQQQMEQLKGNLPEGFEMPEGANMPSGQ